MVTHVNRTIWCKINNPYLVNLMVRTPIFEWYMVCCDSKNGYQNTCNEILKIGSCAQNMMIILDSIVNMIGGGDYTINWQAREFLA